MSRSLMQLFMVIAWSGMAEGSLGQEVQPANDDVRDLIRKMNERIEALEGRHEADQRRIRELEERISRVEEPPVSPPGAGKGVASEPWPAPAPGLAHPSSTFNLSLGAGGSGNAFNPEITVFLDAGGSVSSEGRNKALNRFNLREVELDLRAAISPTVDGVLIVALAEEIESERNGDVTIDRAVELEEGYLNFHTLPHDLALKVGKFRNVFGRNNLLHTHDLPQVTRPLAVQAFFGPEGLATTGASLSWLVPNPWDKYVEGTVEVFNSDGGDESPILGGPNADNPAVLAHLKFFDDVTDTSSLEVGGTYLFARTSGDQDFNANVFGVDVTYHWTDPDPSSFRSWLFQAEALWSRNDIDLGPFQSRRNTSFGAYAFAQYQMGQNWYLGLRGDYSEFPNSETRSVSDFDIALSPYVTVYLSEFIRARLQYEHRWLDFRRGSSEEDAVFLQFTGVFGSHPPHPYWVRR